ncbi:hypothetical protein DRE_07245 [Drechslerella stenobrocha 248]|uniref:Uncharacterized protein n=1 Tax=Drechslerella stenobrocha 248 TaxID=1043628 RepID=W7HVD5_9PEZI|nr:hypothetical protein DRE_07245 [Drechslerella stenobrocha 248]
MAIEDFFDLDIPIAESIGSPQGCNPQPEALKQGTNGPGDGKILAENIQTGNCDPLKETIDESLLPPSTDRDLNEEKSREERLKDRVAHWLSTLDTDSDTIPAFEEPFRLASEPEMPSLLINNTSDYSSSNDNVYAYASSTGQISRQTNGESRDEDLNGQGDMQGADPQPAHTPDDDDDDIFLNPGDDIKLLSSEKIRETELFSPPYVPNNPPQGAKDFRHILGRIEEDQWDNMWQQCFQRVKARRGGVFDPVKGKRAYDPKKGEAERYDAIQGKHGSLEWSIDQLFECYSSIKKVIKAIKENRAQVEDLYRMIAKYEQQGPTEHGNYAFQQAASGVRDRLFKILPSQLHELQVRKTLLKKVGESHLWDIAKEDHKYNYRGEMLRGIVAAQKFFADTRADVGDEELKMLGYRGRI